VPVAPSSRAPPDEAYAAQKTLYAVRGRCGSAPGASVAIRSDTIDAATGEAQNRTNDSWTRRRHALGRCGGLGRAARRRATRLPRRAKGLQSTAVPKRSRAPRPGVTSGRPLAGRHACPGRAAGAARSRPVPGRSRGRATDFVSDRRPGASWRRNQSRAASGPGMPHRSTPSLCGDTRAVRRQRTATAAASLAAAVVQLYREIKPLLRGSSAPRDRPRPCTPGWTRTAASLNAQARPLGHRTTAPHGRRTWPVKPPACLGRRRPWRTDGKARRWARACDTAHRLLWCCARGSQGWQARSASVAVAVVGRFQRRSPASAAGSGCEGPNPPQPTFGSSSACWARPCSHERRWGGLAPARAGKCSRLWH